MKIKHIEAHPYQPPLRKFFGRTTRLGFGELKGLEYGLVKITADDGQSGYGEISTVFEPTGSLLCRLVEESIAPALLGQDPRQIGRIHSIMDHIVEGMEPAKAGVDIAIYDLVGKALNVPVYQLLGGRVREEIPLSFSVMFGEPEEMASLAADLVRIGFKTLKIKVGQPLATDEAAVRLIRESIGDDITIRVDANMAWKTPKQALATLKRLEPYNIELAEQPLSGWDIDGMAYVRSHSPIPIMADESVWAPRTALQVIKANAADYISVYVAESGGLYRAAQIFSMSEAAGIPNAIGSMPETGIGTAAEIHLAAAMANLTLASDVCGSRYFEEDHLTLPLDVHKGLATIPKGPGLGVEINHNCHQKWELKATGQTLD